MKKIEYRIREEILKNGNSRFYPEYLWERWVNLSEGFAYVEDLRHVYSSYPEALTAVNKIKSILSHIDDTDVIKEKIHKLI